MMKTSQLRLSTWAIVGALLATTAADTAVRAGISYGPPPDVQAKITALQQDMAALPPPYTDAQAAAASPVKSVNGAVGAVTVPVIQRQYAQDMAVPTTGVITWSFLVPFNNLPSCYRDLAFTGTGYTFDDPLRVAVSKTAVTYKVTAHPTSLTIASLTLPITLPISSSTIPAGTTLSLTCTAPQ